MSNRCPFCRGYEHFEGRGGGFDFRNSSPTTWLFVGGIAAYVYFSNRQEIPYSHRKHLVLISQRLSEDLGKASYNQVLTNHAGLVCSENHPKTQFVRRIGMRLAQTAAKGSGGGYYEHMKGLDWEFKVVKSPQINALVVPGGKVIVFSGLMEILDREDELAFVLAHEISHEVARHTAEKLSTAGLLAAVKILFYSLFGFSIEGLLVLGLELPYSRRAESEADMIGLQIMAESCYDPRWAPGVHKKIEDASLHARVPELLSTHPTNKSRIAALTAGVPDAFQVYQNQDCEAWRTTFFQALGDGIVRRAAFAHDDY